MTEREPSILKSGGPGDPASVPAPRPATATERIERRPPAPRPREAEGATVVVAGFWHRLAAALVDAAVILPVAWLVTWLAGRLVGMQLPAARRTGIDYWLDLALGGEPALWGGVALTAVVIVLYLLLFQALSGRTLGMRLLRLRVIDVYGDPPTVLRSALRTAGYLVSIATLSLGFIWIGFDREKRGLHDWIAGTYVIRAGSRT